MKNVAGVLIFSVFTSIIIADRESFAKAFSSVAFPRHPAEPDIRLSRDSDRLPHHVQIAERRAITLEHTIKQEGLGIFIAISLLHMTKWLCRLC